MPQMTLIVLFSTLSRVIDEQLASNRFAKQLRRRRSNRNRSRKHQDENCASPAHAFSTHLTSLAPPRRAAMRSTPCSLSRPPTNAIARSRAGFNIPTTLRCVRAGGIPASVFL
jgi:hypothetical protein